MLMGALIDTGCVGVGDMINYHYWRELFVFIGVIKTKI